jgi:hypothetical protein
MPSVRRSEFPCGAAVFPGRLAGAVDASGDHVHRLLQWHRFPMTAAGPAVEHTVLAVGAGDELERGGALGAQAAAQDGTCTVAFDVQNPAVAHVDVLPAADSAVGANGLDDFVGGTGARREGSGTRRHRCAVQGVQVAIGDLPEQGPVWKCHVISLRRISWPRGEIPHTRVPGCTKGGSRNFPGRAGVSSILR